MTASEARAKYNPGYQLDDMLAHIERSCDARLFVYGYYADRLSEAVKDQLIELGYKVIPYGDDLAISWE